MAKLTTITLSATPDRYNLRLATPGQSAYVSPVTGQRYTYERGNQYYRFEGGIRIPIQKNGDRARAIAAWLHALQGQSNHADINLPLPTFEPDSPSWSGTYTSKATTTDGMLTLSGVLKKHNAKAGHYANIANRLVSVVKVVEGNSSDQITIVPNLRLGAEDALSPATKIRARVIRPIENVYLPDYMGPWTLVIEEVV